MTRSHGHALCVSKRALVLVELSFANANSIRHHPPLA